MENQRQKSDNVPTFDMIPMLMANLLEDNKILSAKIDALNKKISMSASTNKVQPRSSCYPDHLRMDFKRADSLPQDWQTYLFRQI